MNPVIDTVGRIGAGFLLVCLGCFLLLHLGKGLAAIWRWVVRLEIDWGFAVLCALVLAPGICWLVGSVAFVFLGVV